MPSIPQDSSSCVGHELAIMAWCDVERVTPVMHALHARLNPVRGSVPVRENLCCACSPMTMVQSANEVSCRYGKDLDSNIGCESSFGVGPSLERLVCVVATRRLMPSTWQECSQCTMQVFAYRD